MSGLTPPARQMGRVSNLEATDQDFTAIGEFECQDLGRCIFPGLLAAGTLGCWCIESKRLNQFLGLPGGANGEPSDIPQH